MSVSRPNGGQVEELRNEVNLSFLLSFRIKMGHRQILIISVIAFKYVQCLQVTRCGFPERVIFANIIFANIDHQRFTALKLNVSFYSIAILRRNCFVPTR